MPGLPGQLALAQLGRQRHRQPVAQIGGAASCQRAGLARPGQQHHPERARLPAQRKGLQILAQRLAPGTGLRPGAVVLQRQQHLVLRRGQHPHAATDLVQMLAVVPLQQQPRHAPGLDARQRHRAGVEPADRLDQHAPEEFVHRLPTDDVPVHRGQQLQRHELVGDALGHAVEGPAQLGELVAATHLDPGAGLELLDPTHAAAQLLKRPQRAPDHADAQQQHQQQRSRQRAGDQAPDRLPGQQHRLDRRAQIEDPVAGRGQQEVALQEQRPACMQSRGLPGGLSRGLRAGLRHRRAVQHQALAVLHAPGRTVQPGIEQRLPQVGRRQLGQPQPGRLDRQQDHQRGAAVALAHQQLRVVRRDGGQRRGHLAQQIVAGQARPAAVQMQHPHELPAQPGQRRQLSRLARRHRPAVHLVARHQQPLAHLQRHATQQQLLLALAGLALEQLQHPAAARAQQQQRHGGRDQEEQQDAPRQRAAQQRQPPARTARRGERRRRIGHGPALLLQSVNAVATPMKRPLLARTTSS